ncbi:MAG: bifunctional oligoribonuclease/PAP phosphatase NrnA [Candidatus Omnitrophica bacterium]|nr:bifunctional oligoribonuclease/PAP phosphatase NrnA [Candidatus Omnitrophota bacterium]MDD4013348.1 bifunctional oligoribonuclease/PAP phosphatase NrnA [Candidatus Omnitrophota bacterium]
MKKGIRMNREDNTREIIRAIGASDNFLITAHVNPEGDSVGSQLAMLALLEKLGKKAVIVNNDNVPDNLRFLPRAETVMTELPDGFIPGAVIVLDCPVLGRTGWVSQVIKDHVIINIDHHVGNEYFGDANWVESSASSVGEMIHGLFSDLGVQPGPEEAASMYTAIVTDTGMFNYSNTTARTHIIAAELISRGANPQQVFSEVYEKKTQEQVRILGKVLSTLKVEEDGLVSHITLGLDMFAGERSKDVSTEEFINYARAVKGVSVAVFFKEKPESPGSINVSFRSTGNMNVNKVAAAFGGGGHKKASGCVLKGKMEDAKRLVLDEVRRVIKEEGAVS